MNKEIRFIQGGVELQDVDLGGVGGGPQNLQVRWDGGGIHINATNAGISQMPTYFGAILRKLNGGLLAFANPDPFASDAPDCTQMGTSQENLSTLSEQEIIDRVNHLAQYLPVGVEVKIVVPPPQKRAFGEHAKVGDAPPVGKKKKEKPAETPPEASFKEEMEQADKDVATVKTSLGAVPLEQIMALLTAPPLDPNVGPLAKRKDGWFADSLLMRLKYGFPIAQEQKVAAKSAGAAFDARGWESMTPATPYFDLNDPNVGADDFIAICLAVHKNHKGAVAPLDVRLDPDGGEQIFIASVREAFAKNAAKKNAAK